MRIETVNHTAQQISPDLFFFTSRHKQTFIILPNHEAPVTRYLATEAIILPRMTAVGAKTLGTQLIAAAEPFKKSKKLPKAVNKTLDSFGTKHEALSNTLRDLVKPEPAGTLDAVQCDRIEDAPSNENRCDAERTVPSQV